MEEGEDTEPGVSNAGMHDCEMVASSSAQNYFFFFLFCAFCSQTDIRVGCEFQKRNDLFAEIV